MAKSFSMESLNAAQRKAVQTLQGPVLILAGAGTGKTRTVTCRIAHMVDRGISPKSILAVTFTNKAALEMRERVGQMVERKAARQIMVSTFHSLCVRILREDIGRLGYKTNFTIYSGSEQSVVRLTGSSLEMVIFMVLGAAASPLAHSSLRGSIRMMSGICARITSL